MKKTVLLILMIFLLSPVKGIAADLAHPELNRIKAEELRRLTDNKSEFILIDSRDSGKYRQGHIKGAINISFDPSGDPNVLKMTLMAIPMDKVIIVYCDSEGENISAGLAMDLYNMGCDMDSIKILSGGMAQWKKMGYPLIKAGE